MEQNHELHLVSNDWGESNHNPMVRAYGLKKNRKAKCRSCMYYSKNTCQFGYPFEHSPDFRACNRYK